MGSTLQIPWLQACIQLDQGELDLRWAACLHSGAAGLQPAAIVMTLCICTTVYTTCPPLTPWCSAVEQLVEVSQTRAIADALLKLRRMLAGGGGGSSSGWRGRSLAQLLDMLEAEMDEQVKLSRPTFWGVGGAFPAGSIHSLEMFAGLWACRPDCGGLPHMLCALRPLVLQGLDALSRSKPGNLARPRRFELAAAINRLRTAQLRQVAG